MGRKIGSYAQTARIGSFRRCALRRRKMWIALESPVTGGLAPNEGLPTSSAAERQDVETAHTTPNRASLAAFRIASPDRRLRRQYSPFVTSPNGWLGTDVTGDSIKRDAN